MQCKHFRKRINKGKYYFYCTILKKEVTLDCYKNCCSKEYKEQKPIKKRTNKQNKIERERYSIIYNDLTKCCVCGLKNGQYDERIHNYTHIDKNEVFEGSYRQASIRLGMITPFCIYCHNIFHNDSEVNLQYKVMFEKEYLKKHTKQEFIYEFTQDYIFISKKKKLKN